MRKQAQRGNKLTQDHTAGECWGENCEPELPVTKGAAFSKWRRARAGDRGEVKGEKKGVCDTDSFKHRHRLPRCPGWWPFLSPLSPGLQPFQSVHPEYL